MVDRHYLSTRKCPSLSHSKLRPAAAEGHLWNRGGILQGYSPKSVDRRTRLPGGRRHRPAPTEEQRIAACQGLTATLETDTVIDTAQWEHSTLYIPGGHTTKHIPLVSRRRAFSLGRPITGTLPFKDPLMDLSTPAARTPTRRSLLSPATRLEKAITASSQLLKTPCTQSAMYPHARDTRLEWAVRPIPSII